MAVNSQISELLAQPLRAEIEKSRHKECGIFFDIFHIERCNVARFCVPTHESGERSLWMLEPTNFSEERRRVIGKGSDEQANKKNWFCWGQSFWG